MADIPSAAFWAAAATIIALLAFSLFRPSIARLIDRVSSASATGVTFQKAQEDTVVESGTAPLAEIMSGPVTASILEREKTVKQDLEKLGLNADKDKVAVLLRALAISRIHAEFDNLANNIFGSQLTLLVNLSSNHSPASIDQARTLFLAAESQFHTIHEGRTFDQWLEFVHSRNLIYVSELGLAITQYGMDFLKHLIDYKLAFSRPG